MLRFLFPIIEHVSDIFITGKGFLLSDDFEYIEGFEFCQIQKMPRGHTPSEHSILNFTNSSQGGFNQYMKIQSLQEFSTVFSSQFSHIIFQ